MESANQLIARIKEDQALRNEITQVMAKQDADALVAFLKANGVTDADVPHLVHLDAAVSDTGELQDKDLEAVAAGSWCNGIKHLVDSF